MRIQHPDLLFYYINNYTLITQHFNEQFATMMYQFVQNMPMCNMQNLFIFLLSCVVSPLHVDSQWEILHNICKNINTFQKEQAYVGLHHWR